MPPEASQIANNFYIQFGAVALLAAAGWGVAWLLWRRLTALQDRFDGLSREVITTAHALNETARDLTQMDRLEARLKELLRDG